MHAQRTKLKTFVQLSPFIYSAGKEKRKAVAKLLFIQRIYH